MLTPDEYDAVEPDSWKNRVHDGSGEFLEQGIGFLAREVDKFVPIGLSARQVYNILFLTGNSIETYHVLLGFLETDQWSENHDGAKVNLCRFDLCSPRRRL